MAGLNTDWMITDGLQVSVGGAGKWRENWTKELQDGGF